jgi:hypothetical protein
MLPRAEIGSEDCYLVLKEVLSLEALEDRIDSTSDYNTLR